MKPNVRFKSNASLKPKTSLKLNTSLKPNIFLTICIFSFLILSLLVYNHYGTIAVNTLKKNTVIVIDVGHGGNDPGKVSIDGIKEKDINLQIAKYLKDYLIAENYTVYLTRETDTSLSNPNVSNKKTSDLNNRIQFTKEKNANYLVSIHQNSYSEASSHGAQTFYYTNSEEGESFAKSIQDALLSFDTSNKRTQKASSSYFILKKSSIPAVIVECGFLSNPEETSKLTDSTYQMEIAKAIADGICNHLKS